VQAGGALEMVYPGDAPAGEMRDGPEVHDCIETNDFDVEVVACVEPGYFAVYDANGTCRYDNCGSTWSGTSDSNGDDFQPVDLVDDNRPRCAECDELADGPCCPDPDRGYDG